MQRCDSPVGLWASYLFSRSVSDSAVYKSSKSSFVYCDSNNTQAQTASARYPLLVVRVSHRRSIVHNSNALWRFGGISNESRRREGSLQPSSKNNRSQKSTLPCLTRGKRLKSSSAIARYDVSESHSLLDNPIHIQVHLILNSALRPLKTKFLKRRLWKSGPVVLTLTRVVLTDNAFELLLTPLFHTALVEREGMSVPRRLDAECSALQLSCQVRATSRQAALRLPYITQHYWFLPEHATIISRL